MKPLRIIFDLDGTLIDSAGSLAAAVNALLAELGRPGLPQATVRGFIGHGTDMLVERSLRATGGVPENGARPHQDRFLAIYAADPVTGVLVYPGVRETLGRLARAGHGLAICTQKPEAPARRLLEALDLMPPVSGLTGGDTTPFLKPDPALLQHAAGQLPPGPVIFVGDSEVDAATASAAGVPFLLRLGGYAHGAPSAIPCNGAFGHFGDLPRLVDALAPG